MFAIIGLVVMDCSYRLWDFWPRPEGPELINVTVTAQGGVPRGLMDRRSQLHCSS